MQYTMLTVFKNNHNAQIFFRGLKYETSEFSPKLNIFEATYQYSDVLYDVLSKKTKHNLN